jgi:hypothetical protein
MKSIIPFQRDWINLKSFGAEYLKGLASLIINPQSIPCYQGDNARDDLENKEQLQAVNHALSDSTCISLIHGNLIRTMIPCLFCLTCSRSTRNW